MIPQIIHQTWKTKELPDEFEKWHNLIKELHPGWDIRLWDDEENLQLVKDHFPHLIEKYQDLEYNIMRADIIRYMYMAVFGGYYLDLDYELFFPLDHASPNAQLLLPISRERNNNKVIGNCIFGSAKDHVFWKDVLEEFDSNFPIKKIYIKKRIIELTGPSFISKIYFKNPEKYRGTLLPRNLFHPDNTIADKSENYKDILKKNGAYGIHHCSETWLKGNKSLFDLISRLFYSPYKNILK